MRSRRASPAAMVVARCQRSKVSRSCGERTITNDVLRPRAIVCSSRTRCEGRSHADTRTHGQAHLDTCS
jgi:hypothetical protein